VDLRIGFDDRGELRVFLGEELYLARLAVGLPGREEPTPTAWESPRGDRTWRRRYQWEGEPTWELELRELDSALLVRVKLLRDLRGISQQDSFETPGLLAPSFSFPDFRRFFLATYGLGGEHDHYPGGYWPTAVVGTGPEELPREAFAPLVLWGEGGALAISPGNFFLTSPLVRIRGGAARGLHGAIDSLPAGFTLDTWLVAGPDPFSALSELARRLSPGRRPSPPTGGQVLERLGWWNAYGGYYTELFRPLNGEELERVVAGLRAAGVPLGYLGLDLWYPYEEIGKALRYRADPRKYPQGLRPLRERWGLPFVLHLSALSERNEYRAPGGHPEVYREIAQDLREEGAVAAWHDWLRTQQFLTQRLRAEPQAAESWFSGMARAFSEAGLPVILCMHTMGMVLAATQHPNVISARSHTDYLFSQRPALEEAARHGREEMLGAWVPPGWLRAQNLTMGAVLAAFGLAPFFDLFLSRPHPGLGGEEPEAEAALRALSCGPVGIGDGPGMSDPQLLARLLVRGKLARPDHPPRPLLPTLGQELQTFLATRQAGELAWGYLVVVNTGQEELPFRVDPPWEGEFRLWDGFTGRPVREAAGRLAPGGVAYFVASPLVHGCSPWGLRGKLVPAPREDFSVQRDGRKLRVWTGGEPLVLWSPTALLAAGDQGPASLTRKGELWLVAPSDGADWLTITRR